MLAGRDDELRSVHALVRQAGQGSGGALLLCGEPGIGKSALLDAGAADAQGFLILRTTGVESESRLAYAGLTELLTPLADSIPQLPTAFGHALSRAQQLDSATDGFVVAAAFAALLVTSAEERPVLMLVDDVQWVDAPSAQAITFAARRLRQTRVGSLLAWRDTVAAPVALDGLATIRLAPLEDGAAEELLESVEAEAGTRARILRAAGGNPLALLELARDPANIDRSSESVAERLFGTRLDRLDDQVREVLLIAALERAGDLSVVAAAGNSDGLARLTTVGLVDVGIDRLTLRHPLLRSLVIARSWPEQRRSAHAALAAVLPPSDERLRHRALAATQADEELARDLETFGRRGSPTEGAWALERAAALTPPGSDRGRRLTLAAQAVLNSGDVDNARRLIGLAREDDDLVANQDARALEARLAVSGGELVEGGRLLSTVARDMARDRPRDAARLFVESAVALTAARRLADGWDVLRRARELALEDEPVLRLLIASAEADLEFASGDVRPAVLRARAAALAADTEPAVHRVPRDRLCLAELMFGGGLNDRAREVSTAVADDARREGALGTLRYALSLVFSVELVTGRIFAASAAANEELELATQFSLLMEQEEALGHVAWCDALQARPDSCWQRVQERYDLGRRVFSDVVPHPSLGVLELGLGHFDGAITNCRANLERLATRGGFTTATLMPHQADLIEAYVRSGRRAAAAEILVEFEREARLLDVPQTMALVYRCRGLLAAGETRDDEFARSLEYHQVEARPIDRARTLLCWGERERRAGRRLQARAHLSDALEQFDRSGVELWARRARLELAASGQRGVRRAVPSGATLTGAERRVAALVAEGLSNREVATRLFVSVNTIETHLRHLFMKLDVRSRTELSRKITEIRDSALPG